MSGGRARVVGLLAAVSVAVAVLSYGPRVSKLAEQLVDAREPGASVGAELESAPRWATPVTGWPTALAGDAHGAVVLAGRGEVRALDHDGSTRWRVHVPGAALHAPAIDRTTVLVGTGAAVVAIDRDNGAVRWEAVVPDAGLPNPVALSGGLALTGTEAGVLVAFDARTGETRWSATFPGAIRTPPVVDRNADIVAATWHGGPDPRLRALDLGAGAPRWDAPLMQFATGPVVAAGRVTVGEGDGEYSARIVGRAADDGSLAWSIPAPASFESGITPGADAGTVAVVDHFGTVSVVDARRGDLQWRTELAQPVLRTTVVLDDRSVALTTHGGAVVVLAREKGETRYQGSPAGYPAGVALAGDDLLVALRLREPGRVESIPLPLH